MFSKRVGLGLVGVVAMMLGAGCAAPAESESGDDAAPIAATQEALGSDGSGVDPAPPPPPPSSALSELVPTGIRTSVARDGMVSVSATVKNASSTPTGGQWVWLYRRRWNWYKDGVPFWQGVYFQHLDGIPAGGSVEVKFDLPGYSWGPEYAAESLADANSESWLVEFDSTNAIPEANEKNNTIAKYASSL